MPVAEKFKILGAGNGFPFCLDKVNVSACSHKAPMELKDAVKIYWNLAYVNGSSTVPPSDPPVNGQILTVTASSGVMPWSDWNPDQPMDYREILPKERIETEWEYITTPYYDGGVLQAPLEYYMHVQQPDFGAYESVEVNTFIQKPERLYDGSTGDESNFIGYGFRYIATARSNFESDDLSMQTYRSYFSGYDHYNQTFSVTSVDGIPIVKGVVNGANGTASLGSFEFYTYPE